jgi:hypothetical protein
MQGIVYINSVIWNFKINGLKIIRKKEILAEDRIKKVEIYIKKMHIAKEQYFWTQIYAAVTVLRIIEIIYLNVYSIFL